MIDGEMKETEINNSATSLLTGLPSMTHDDQRQNGHLNSHQYSDTAP